MTKRSKPSIFAAVRAVIVVFFFVSEIALAHKGIGFQAVLKKPDGTYPTATGLTVTLQVLDPSNDCVLREEVHTGVPITNGYMNLVLGSSSASTPAGLNPTPVLTIPEVMDNATAKSGLNCVDTTNAIVSSSQTYTPADTHARKLRVRTTILGDPIVADFNMRAIAFAVNAENLGGKGASSFVQTSPAITQANVQSIFARYGTLDSILNGTYAGNAATATALATAPGACPAGQYLSAMSASGTITCGTPAGGSGSVTSVTSANSYLSVATGTSTPVLTLNVGTAANTVAAGNDSRFTDSRAPNGTAGGDLSGSYPNPTVAKISGKSVVLTTPATGEVLKYDGTNFVNASGADATKLPLAGGTMTGAIDMGSQNMTSLGYVTMSANKNLHLSNNASDPAGLVAADKGKIWFNTTSGEIKYWNGSAAQSLGVAGSGLANFNTQTGSTQTLAIGTSGTAPAWNSATNTHTLNIPMASTASVTAGLLSKTDYDAFNAKLGTATSFAGDVTGTSGAMSVDKIKGKAISATTFAAGQTLRYDGTNWINAVLGFADLGSKPTTLAGFGITDAQSSTLADGKILVGNGSNVATALTMSGDATLSNAGALTLATVPISKGGTGVTSFTGDRLITTSAAGALQASSCALNEVVSFTAGGAITCVPNADSSKLPLAGGTMTGAIAMGGQNITNTGFITMATDKSLHLSNNSADPSGLVAADKGKVWFNSTAGVIKYWDGSAAQSLGVSGSGLSNFNTQTGSTQTLAIGTSGTAPAWNSAANTHTLNIPMASTASVTAGLLSKTDYDAFNAKLGTATSFAGDVTGTSSTTSVDKIKGKTVSATTYAAGQTLRYDGTNWVNAVLGFADLGSTPTTLAGYGITDAQSSTLANGKIFVGNGSNVATAVSVSGDATLANTGALTLATVPITKGGTGVTSFTGDKVITTSAAGALQASSCALNEVISFTAGGAITCVNVNSLVTGFANGGNSFAASAILGTNDANSLAFKTANTTRMTILSGGNIGVGTANPGSMFSVEKSANSTTEMQVSTPGTGTNQDALFSFVTKSNNSWLGQAGNKGWMFAARGDAFSNAAAQNDLLLSYWNGSTYTHAMHFDSVTGNVGIGTSTPSGTLEVAGGTAAAATNGKNIILTAQSAGTGNQSGGNIVLMPGAKSGTGANGAVTIGTATPPSWVDTNSLYVTNKIYGGSVLLGTGGDLGWGDDTTRITGTAPAGTLGFFTSNTQRIHIEAGGNIGIGVVSPNSKLDIDGAITQRGIASPAVSAAGQGAIYFDSTANKFKVSQNGAAYVDLVGSSGGTLSGDVSGATSSTSVDKIKGKAIAATTYAAGQTLRYDGTDWVNSVLNFADLGTKPTTLAGYGITDAQSTTLANGKILVGNGSNVATAVTMSGDATLSNAGALTLATVPISKGGTGVTSFAADKIITTSAGGALQATSCALNEVISFTAGGAITCVSIGSGGSGFANGGNSYTAAATLGTNDAYALNLETNNSPRVTILSDGSVGVGTQTPTSMLNVKNGSIVTDSVSSTVAYINYGVGNVQMSSTAATTINICGLKDGGTYTLVLTGVADASTVTINAYPTYVNTTSCSGTAMRVDLGAGLSTFTTMGATNILSFVYFSSRGANGTVYGFPATNFTY